MRRKAGIAVIAGAAVVLAGAAGVTAWQYAGDDDRRPVGTWHQAPGLTRTPVAVQRRAESAPNSAVVPRATARPAQEPSATTATTGATADPAKATGSKPAEASELRTGRRVESASTGRGGRQRVGELVRVSKLLDYLGTGPKKETFSYPGASYVKLHFGRMAMLPGDYLTVSNPDGTESYRYDAPGVLNSGRVDKWAMSVTGDTAVLEVHRGAAGGLSSLLGTLGVGVDRVARGFSRTEQNRQPEAQLTAPGRTGREE